MRLAKGLVFENLMMHAANHSYFGLIMSTKEPHETGGIKIKSSKVALDVFRELLLKGKAQYS